MQHTFFHPLVLKFGNTNVSFYQFYFCLPYANGRILSLLFICLFACLRCISKTAEQIWYKFAKICYGDRISHFGDDYPTSPANRVPPGHGKSWNLERPFSRPGKSWKIAKVMESHGK